MKLKKFSIVIPSWNSYAQLKQNLASIMVAAQKVNATITVVDDASDDGVTLDYLKTLEGRITLIINPNNLGFAKTVNLGVKSCAAADIVVLLNTDVRLDPDALLKARSYFDDHNLFALTLNSGEGYAAARVTHGLLQHYAIKTNQKVPAPSLWASGGQGIFARDKWLDLGGMDPLYAPFYWEDVDLGYRAWKNGWSILWAPDCRCVHDHKSSVIANNFSSKKVEQTALRNQLLFFWKNITDRKMILAHLFYLPRFILLYPKPFLTALRRLPQVISTRLLSSHTLLTDQEILNHWT